MKYIQVKDTQNGYSKEENKILTIQKVTKKKILNWVKICVNCTLILKKYAQKKNYVDT